MTQHKELPVLPEPNVPEGDWFVLDCYIKEYAQAYGAACAAHARERALSEAIAICRRNAQNTSADELEALKGK